MKTKHSQKLKKKTKKTPKKCIKYAYLGTMKYLVMSKKHVTLPEKKKSPDAFNTHLSSDPTESDDLPKVPLLKAPCHPLPDSRQV